MERYLLYNTPPDGYTDTADSLRNQKKYLTEIKLSNTPCQ